MAIVLVIEPIFEADLEPEQYGYRRKRSAQDAVQAVHSLLNQGYREVIDADLSGYFDSIPHAELIRCVTGRISEGEMLALIKRFLKARVSDRNEPEQPDSSEGNEQGTPQGFTAVAAACKSPHPAVHPGMEETGSDGALSGADRQLRR
jgi:retron-type reverse transcriptase